MNDYIQIHVFTRTRETLRKIRGKTGETLSGIVDRLADSQWGLIKEITDDYPVSALYDNVDLQINELEAIIQENKTKLSDGSGWEDVVAINLRIQSLYRTRDILLSFQKSLPIDARVITTDSPS